VRGYVANTDLEWFRFRFTLLRDRGYVTVTPDYRFQVGRRLREDWQNGRTYYPLHGTRVHVPDDPALRPAPELLAWHNEHVFLG